VVDLAAAHGLADTLDSRRNLAAARRRLRGPIPCWRWIAGLNEIPNLEKRE
jgi:hypothetical protein